MNIQPDFAELLQLFEKHKVDSAGVEEPE